MTFIGRLHPLLIHFPIALVLAAAGAEGVAAITHDGRWRLVAVRNLRLGAAAALVATIAGWLFALSSGMDSTSLLAWHAWLGTAAAVAATAGALAARRVNAPLRHGPSIYRIALFGAGALVGLAAHLGGLLVWGADFLRL